MNARTIAIGVMIVVGLAALIASGSSKPGGSGGGHHTTKTASAHAGGSGNSPSKDVTIVSCTTINGQPVTAHFMARFLMDAGFYSGPLGMHLRRLPLPVAHHDAFTGEVQ